jgi:hypothetical protein
MRRAITTPRRQEATLNLLAARARKKVTPEQRWAAYAENARRLYAREDENRAAAAPPLDPYTRQLLRKMVDQFRRGGRRSRWRQRGLATEPIDAPWPLARQRAGLFHFREAKASGLGIGAKR